MICLMAQVDLKSRWLEIGLIIITNSCQIDLKRLIRE
nr:MAG TPA_asm: hypothetical protein [Caudoviricetes sp.]